MCSGVLLVALPLQVKKVNLCIPVPSAATQNEQRYSGATAVAKVKNKTH